MVRMPLLLVIKSGCETAWRRQRGRAHHAVRWRAGMGSSTPEGFRGCGVPTGPAGARRAWPSARGINLSLKMGSSAQVAWRSTGLRCPRFVQPGILPFVVKLERSVADDFTGSLEHPPVCTLRDGRGSLAPGATRVGEGPRRVALALREHVLRCWVRERWRAVAPRAKGALLGRPPATHVSTGRRCSSSAQPAL